MKNNTHYQRSNRLSRFYNQFSVHRIIFQLFFMSFFSFSLFAMDSKDQLPGLEQLPLVQEQAQLAQLEQPDKLEQPLTQKLVTVAVTQKPAALSAAKNRAQTLAQKREKERLAREREMQEKDREIELLNQQLARKTDREADVADRTAKIASNRGSKYAVTLNTVFSPRTQAELEYVANGSTEMADDVKSFIAEVKKQNVVGNAARATEATALTAELIFIAVVQGQIKLGLPVPLEHAKKFQAIMSGQKTIQSNSGTGNSIGDGGIVGGSDQKKDFAEGAPVGSEQEQGDPLAIQAIEFWNKQFYPNALGFLATANGHGNPEDKSRGADWAKKLLQGFNGIEGFLKVLSDLGDPKPSQLKLDFLVTKNKVEKNMGFLAGRSVAEEPENAFLNRNATQIDDILTNFALVAKDMQDGAKKANEVVGMYGAALIQSLDQVVVLDKNGNAIKDLMWGDKLRILMKEIADDIDKRALAIGKEVVRENMGSDSWVGQIGKLVAVGVSIAVIIACKRAYDTFGGIKKIRKDFISFIREVLAEVARGGDIGPSVPAHNKDNKDNKDSKDNKEKNAEADAKNGQKDAQKDSTNKAQEQVAKKRPKEENKKENKQSPAVVVKKNKSYVY